MRSDDRLAFDAGVSFSVPQRLTLDAPAIAVTGKGIASMVAGTLLFGPQANAPARSVASSGDGVLTLAADQIDINGSIALQGIRDSVFTSAGDINLFGYGTVAAARDGLLATGGNLTMAARRVAVGTGSKFTIAGSGTDSRVRFEQIGTSSGTPLSVAGSLTVQAARIEQAGSLYAPFGQITLTGSRYVNLESGSLTSVSGNGLTIPYGRVDNGSSWLWGLDQVNPNEVSWHSGSRRPYGCALGVAQERRRHRHLRRWRARRHAVHAGHRRHARRAAGGAMPGTYAIVPSLAGQSAPYDPMFWSDAGLARGDSIVIGEGAAVPAGVYTLLPARYALLPGAWLVTPADASHASLPAGKTAITADGATVVTGYRTTGAHLNAGAVTSGFELRPGSVRAPTRNTKT